MTKRETEVREPIGDPDDETGDFAGEHDAPTYANQQAGGPEETREEESPHGLSGADED
jgi:hypothetical protein